MLEILVYARNTGLWPTVQAYGQEFRCVAKSSGVWPRVHLYVGPEGFTLFLS